MGNPNRLLTTAVTADNSGTVNTDVDAGCNDRPITEPVTKLDKVSRPSGHAYLNANSAAA